jgi:inorganic pyrophosphatase
MAYTTFLQEATKFEIQRYRRPANPKELKLTHVAFSGSPRKHPYNSQKVILVVDPYSTNTYYYEFDRDDISYVEELPNIVNIQEETITVVRVWVKKSSIAVRSTPFLVGETFG